MDKVSVAIATYEMKGKGAFFIRRCIDSIINQRYKDIEIVISDHSVNDEILEVCKTYKYDIKYIKNSNLRGSSSANFNNAILNSSGDYIKILCQDDCLFNSDSIDITLNAIKKNNKKWLVSSYYHTRNLNNLNNYENLHNPSINNFDPLLNLIGTHSCLTISKDVDIFFDEKLIWFMDCEYYSRLFIKYSYPEYLYSPTLIQSLWDGQVTNSIVNNDIINVEMKYIKNKLLNND